MQILTAHKILYQWQEMGSSEREQGYECMCFVTLICVAVATMSTDNNFVFSPSYSVRFSSETNVASVNLAHARMLM